jgi:hypothetical protein
MEQTFLYRGKKYFDRDRVKIITNKIVFPHVNSYLRDKCKKLSFIARTGLKYDRGTRDVSATKELFTHFIYDCEITRSHIFV